MFNNIKLEKPIFITGCSNSGTSVLFYSLLWNEELGGFLQEVNAYCKWIPKNVGLPDRLFSLAPAFYEYYFKLNSLKEIEVKSELLNCLSNPNFVKKGKRLVFKDPRFSLRLKWLKKIFPDSYIIAIIRNPYAVIEGIMRRDKRININQAILQYIITNKVIEKEGKEIDKFKLIKYEDMIKADKFPPSKFWDSLLDFLELDKNRFRIPTKTNWSKFDKTRNQTSIKRLSRWEKELITFATSDIMEKYGYEKE